MRTPVLVTSARFDEMTPSCSLSDGAPDSPSERATFELSAHLAFIEEPGAPTWSAGSWSALTG
jgi:hypothetical protein